MENAPATELTTPLGAGVGAEFNADVSVESARASSGWLNQSHAVVQRALRVLQVLMDGVALVLAFIFGYLLRTQAPLFPVAAQTPDFNAYSSMMVVHIATMLIIFFFARLYHLKRAVSRIDLLYTVSACVAVGTVMTSGFVTIFLKNTGAVTDYPRQMILYVWFFSVICVVVGRELHRQAAVQLRVAGVGRDRLLVVGSGNVAEAIIRQVVANPSLGYEIIGAVNGVEKHEVAGVSIIGHPEDIPQLIDRFEVDEVIIALPEASHKDLLQLITYCQRGKVSIKVYPDLFAYMAGGMSVDELGGLPLLTVRDIALRGWKLSLKRGLDMLGAAAGLVLLSPWMLLTAVVIRVGSPGPVFFTQERCGLDGRPFAMIKFRTMRTDAEAKGPGWTTKGDARVTRLGKWMRRTNWDEIPNLINVFLGQMSLVGPRPEQVYFVQKFRTSIPRYMERHREKAGMTGWAQVNGLRGDTSLEERTKYDLWYVEHWSLWLDIKIILRTILQTLSGNSKNAY